VVISEQIERVIVILNIIYSSCRVWSNWSCRMVDR